MARQIITARLSDVGVQQMNDLTAKLTVDLGGHKPVTRTEVLRAALQIAFSNPDRLEQMILRIRAKDKAKL